MQAGHDPQVPFARAYQDMVDRWPVPVTAVDAATSYGTTHLLISGAEDAPPALLLPGGAATATAWSALTAELSRSHRTIAVDPIGQPGLSSTRGQRPIKTVGDLAGWLDQLLTALAIERVALVGHSYGAWIALRYALHASSRVDRIVLLDPTYCFATLSLRYRLRAVPMLVRPSARRISRFLAWETRGRPLNPAWLAVATSAHDQGRPSIVMPKRPRRAELAGLGVPALIVVAARSRAHNPGRVARCAREQLPGAAIATAAAATHHTIPTEDARELAGYVTGFLTGAARP